MFYELHIMIRTENRAHRSLACEAGAVGLKGGN